LPGVDGLLHISEIPRHRQGALREMVGGAGTELLVTIVNVDLAKRRIALALAPEGATVPEPGDTTGAEAQPPKSGFGITLGDFLKERRR